MYRVFLFIACLTYCSSAPPADLNARKSKINEDDDIVDLVDTAGSGYSYFKKQKIDFDSSSKQSLDISDQDLAAYTQGSAFRENLFKKQRFSPLHSQIINNNAFGQQQLIPRSNFEVENLLPKTIQNDFSQSNRYVNQQGNFPIQSPRSLLNTFSNHQQDLRNNIGSQQFLLPQSNFNNQQQTFNQFRNQQPQQSWNNQQKSMSYSSSYDGDQQKPFSSSFMIQSNQQNDQPPITNAAFISSEYPTQRFISSKQPISNNIW